MDKGTYLDLTRGVPRSGSYLSTVTYLFDFTQQEKIPSTFLVKR